MDWFGHWQAFVHKHGVVDQRLFIFPLLSFSFHDTTILVPLPLIDAKDGTGGGRKG